MVQKLTESRFGISKLGIPIEIRSLKNKQPTESFWTGITGGGSGYAALLARGMSSVRYRTRLGDLKNKQSTESLSVETVSTSQSTCFLASFCFCDGSLCPIHVFCATDNGFPQEKVRLNSEPKRYKSVSLAAKRSVLTLVDGDDDDTSSAHKIHFSSVTEANGDDCSASAFSTQVLGPGNAVHRVAVLFRL